jgi:hypothetical protein
MSNIAGNKAFSSNNQFPTLKSYQYAVFNPTIGRKAKADKAKRNAAQQFAIAHNIFESKEVSNV